jgi:hypothetical protein
LHLETQIWAISMLEAAISFCHHRQLDYRGPGLALGRRLVRWLAGSFPAPPLQDASPSYRAFAGSVLVIGLRSGPNTGHAQLPKNAGLLL